MKYKEALDWLYGLQAIGMKLGLENMKLLCGLLDNPQEKFKSIHVAGTNGKGSTAAFLSSIFKAQGLSCGLTTSPHLVDITERIQVSEQNIPRKRLQEIIEKVVAVLQAYNEDKSKNKKLSPTFFEVIISIAFVYFAEEEVDVAVIETGLGGRLDSTNILNPVLSIITNVSLEHTQYLGNSIESIAKEKGGIIKKNVDTLSTVDQQEAIAALQEIARNKNSSIWQFGKDFSAKKYGKGISYKLNGCSNIYEIGLNGEHQLKNASLAVLAVDRLNKKGFNVSEKSLRKGLKDVRWPGRLELLKHSTPWLIDCAHNPAAMNTLASYLKNEFANKKIMAIFAAMQDKEYDKMLSTLSPLVTECIFTKPVIDRAEEPEILKNVCPNSIKKSVEKKVSRALTYAVKVEKDYDLVLVTGSIFLVGEAYPFITKHTKNA